MGSENVNKVFEHWPHLPDQPFRALTYLAKTARDDDTPPVYFGGWESVCKALGVNLRDIKVPSMKRTTLRVIGELTKAGCVVSSDSSSPGRRTDYALALDPNVTYRPKIGSEGIAWEQIPRTQSGDSEYHPAGDSECHPFETVSVTHSRQSVSPVGDSECHPHYKSTTKHSNNTSISTTTSGRVENATLSTRANEKILDDDEPLTTEQNRQRQLAELEAMMQNEGKTA